MKFFLSVFVVGCLSFITPRAYSLPKYSLQEQKRCVECHYNKKGGGPLNEKGKFYGQHRTLVGLQKATASRVTIRKKAPEEKKITSAEPIQEKPMEISTEKPVTEVAVVNMPPPKPVTQAKKEETLLDRTHLSASLLMSYLLGEDSEGPNSFFFMRAEPMVTTQITKNFMTVFGYNFATPLLTAYGQFNLDNFYVQLGSFHLPFGLETPDYNNTVSTLIKEHYDLTQDTRDIGIEAGYEKDWFLRLSVVNGAREPRERPTLLPSFDHNLGYVVNGGYQGIAYDVPFLLGGSVLYERRIPPGDVLRGRPPLPLMKKQEATALFGIYGQLNIADFSLLAETMYGRHTPHQGDRSFGFYVRPALNITDNWNMSARFDLFGRDRKFLKDSFMRYVVSSEYHFSKYASIEPQIRINDESGIVEDVHDDEFILLVHMNF